MWTKEKEAQMAEHRKMAAELNEEKKKYYKALELMLGEFFNDHGCDRYDEAVYVLARNLDMFIERFKECTDA